MMSTKSLEEFKCATKRSKNVSKSKKDNGSEILVLPPNLLEKLGINLESLKNAGCSQNKNIYEGVELSNNLDKNEINGSSMLETASLMKDSVYLSPTFSCNVVNTLPIQTETNVITESEKNVILEEINIINQDVNGSGVLHEFTFVHCNDELETDIIPKHKPIFNVDSDLNHIHIDTVNPNSVGEYGDEINEDIVCSDAENILNGINDIICIKDQQDPSNEALTAIPNNQTSNDNDLILQSKDINIISEEKLSPTDYVAVDLNLSCGLTAVPIEAIPYNEDINNMDQIIPSDDIVSHQDILYISHECKPDAETSTLITLCHDEDGHKSLNHAGGDVTLQKSDDLNVADSKEKLDTNICADKQSENNELLTQGEFNENKEGNNTAMSVMDLKNNSTLKDSEEGSIPTDIHITPKMQASFTQCQKSIQTSTNESFHNDENIIDAQTCVGSSSIKPESTNIASKKTIGDEILDCEKNCLDKESISQKCTTSTESISNVNVASDKVEEIAKYLMTFVKNYKKRHIESNIVVKSKKNVLKTENVSKNVIKSKLCIQGVEKPGGMYEPDKKRNAKKLKTYRALGKLGRNEKDKIVKEMYSLIKQHELTGETTDQDLNIVSTGHSYESNQFCICKDFGRLEYYDSDDVYEHIHFWAHSSSELNSDVILSIFHEDTDGTKQIINDFNIEDVIYDTSISIHNSICCHYHGDEQETQNEAKNYALTRDSTTSSLMENEQIISTNDITTKLELEANIVNAALSSPKITNVVDIKDTEDSLMPFASRIESNAQIEIGDSDAVICNNDETSATNIETFIEESENIVHDDDLTQTDEQCKLEDNSSEPTDVKTEHEKELDVEMNPEAEEIETTESDSQTTNFAEDPNQPHQNATTIIIENHIVSITDSENTGEDGKTPVTSERKSRNKKKDINFNTHTKKSREDRRISTQSTEHSDNGNCSNQSPETPQCSDRKRSHDQRPELRRSNSNSCDEPCTKKDLKCGVCDKLLSVAEWEDHRRCEHCLIAWKEGEVFDFDDAQLLINLRELIKLKGVLKCSSCSTEKRNSKNFLTHVKKCLRREASENQVNCVDSQIAAIESTVCGVCKQIIQTDDWMVHIKKEHNYLAWKETEIPINLDDENEVYRHLSELSKELGGLVCGECGFIRKHVRKFLTHVKNCNRNDTTINESNVTRDRRRSVLDANSSAQNSDENNQLDTTSNLVKCGVCSVDVDETEWIVHIGQQHNYLAWKDGSTPLDLGDERALQNHLTDICKQNGFLKCSKCGKKRKTVKFYQLHIQECMNLQMNADGSLASLNDTIESSANIIDVDPDTLVKCGVCKMEISGRDWVKHIQTLHNYLAWIEGQPPIELHDAEVVHKYLLSIVKKMGTLTCPKCNLSRKYPKVFLSHVARCVGFEHTPMDDVFVSSGDDVQCGVCLAKVDRKTFKNHATSKHYSLAWIVGEDPIDLRNPHIVEKYLKLYSRQRTLVCRICGEARASCMGFYAHILTCGKTEEEIDTFKNVCDICNNKYLFIYKYQHMKMHRDHEAAIIKKQEMEAAKAEEKDKKVETSGRRKAAEKAKNIIDKYASHIQCSVCRTGFDDDKELAEHECAGVAGSDSEVSMKLEESSDDDDDDDVDSNISGEEENKLELDKKKIKHDSSTISRLPFDVPVPENYILEAGKDFYKTHFTSEVLFDEWRCTEFETVPQNELNNYLPTVEESCSFRFNSSDWKTYKRFQAKVGKGAYIFTGGCVQCLAWAPNIYDCPGHYLAVLVHRTPDVPRYVFNELVTHPNLIQIWTLGNFTKSVPKLSLGIAHEYGTVWSACWCPSGARDSLPDRDDSDAVCRLGLLAVACSNGHAYIYSVPYPSTIPNKDDNMMYKLKPVVDLRLTDAKRKLYPATSICWSPQKGHTIILVGYANGSTAYFDLKTSSPILRTVENDIIVLYPYYDERAHSTSVTELEVYPSQSSGQDGRGPGNVGVVCSGALSGAGLRVGKRAVHVVAPAARVRLSPLWPSILLGGDNGITTYPMNEVELTGENQRRGVTRSWAGCWCCGRLVAFRPPTLRTTVLHPAETVHKREIIGNLSMVPKQPSRKRKLKTDDLAVVLDPITYEDTIDKYGLEWSEESKERSSSPSRLCQPIRFPLGDAANMAFYPSQRYHSKLSIGTHAGFVLIINVP